MFLRFSLGILLAAWAAPAAWAQRGGSGPRSDEYGGVGPGIRPLSENRLDRFADILKLNKQQKNAAKETFDAAQQEAAPLRDQIQKSRVELVEAMVNKKSQPEVDQILTNHGMLLAQMTGIEMRAFAKVFEGLTPDQQKRAAPALAMMSGMFSTRNWNGN